MRWAGCTVAMPGPAGLTPRPRREEYVQPLGRTSTTRPASRNLSQNQLSCKFTAMVNQDIDAHGQPVDEIWLYEQETNLILP